MLLWLKGLCLTVNTDQEWNISRIKVARNLTVLKDKWQRIQLGVIDESQSNTGLNITLVDQLEGDVDNEPTVLSSKNYSLNNYGGTSVVWVENPNGNNYARWLIVWRPGTARTIRISTAFVTPDGQSPTSDTSPTPPIGGKKIFVRRLRTFALWTSARPA